MLSSNHSSFTVWTFSARGFLPYMFGPSQLSSDHLRPPSAISFLCTSHAPCFRIAILTPAPQAVQCCTPPAACQLSMTLCNVSVHSFCFASPSLALFAQSSASSSSGSPQCALTSSRNDTAPLSTRWRKIDRRRSSWATPANVAREPSHSHFSISVISLLQSSSNPRHHQIELVEGVHSQRNQPARPTMSQTMSVIMSAQS